MNPEWVKEARAYLVRNYVRENLRAPSEEELQESLRRLQEANPEMDLVGLSSNVEYPVVRRAGSAAEENERRSLIYTDLVATTQRLKATEKKINESRRQMTASFQRASLQMDRLLLKAGAVEDLLNRNTFSNVSIQESFENYVPVVSSDLDISNGQVALFLDGDETVDFQTATASINLTGLGPGYIGSFSSGKLTDIYRDNGKFWQRIGMTNTQDVGTILTLTWLFEDPIDVTSFSFFSAPSPSTRWYLEYSSDGTSWSSSSESFTMRAHNATSVGLNVYGVRLIIQKDAADRQLETGAWGHVYVLDRVTASSSPYESSGECVLGPYEVRNAFGDFYLYGSATMDVCADLPDETSISYSVSRDGSTWVALDPDSLDAVLSDQSATVTPIDSAVDVQSLIETTNSVSSVDFGSEAILNAYADTQHIEPELVTIKRNIAFGDGESVSGAPRQWSLIDGVYWTTAETTSYRQIDFGNASISLNGNIVSGVVDVPPGIHRFGVESANWTELTTTTFQSLADLEAADPLYPHNHRYLLEGVTYGTNYTGDKIYLGVEDLYGERMLYMPMEAFVRLDDSDPLYYQWFSILYEGGNTYYIVKVNKQYSTWQNERYDVDWIEPTANSLLYIRVQMSTSDTLRSPALQDLSARLI